MEEGGWLAQRLRQGFRVLTWPWIGIFEEENKKRAEYRKLLEEIEERRGAPRVVGY